MESNKGVSEPFDETLFALLIEYYKQNVAGRVILDENLRRIKPERIADVGVQKAEQIIELVKKGAPVTDVLKEDLKTAMFIAIFGKGLMQQKDGWIDDRLNDVVTEAAKFNELSDNIKGEVIKTIRDKARVAAGIVPKTILTGRNSYGRR